MVTRFVTYLGQPRIDDKLDELINSTVPFVLAEARAVFEKASLFYSWEPGALAPRTRRVQKIERHLNARRAMAFTRSPRSRRRTDGALVRREASAERIPGTGPSADAHRLLRGLAVVVVEQAAQPLATADASMTTSDAIVPFDQPVIEALMIALSMIMRNVFADRSAKRFLTEEDHPVEAFAFDRQNKPLDESVQIRRTVGSLITSVPASSIEARNSAPELLVAVQDEESLAEKKGVDRIGEVASDPHHKRAA